MLELPHWYLPRRYRSIVFIELRGLQRWELLWYGRAFGRHRYMCRGTVLGSVGLGLHKLPSGSVSSKRRVDELHELPHRHLSRHDWSVVNGDLCGMHRRELLRGDRSCGRNRDLRRWAIFGGLGFSLHELSCWSISSQCCLDKLHELPRWHLPRYDRRVVACDLRVVHWWELLRHDRAVCRHGELRRWTIFSCRGNRVHELPCGSVSSDRSLHQLHELPHWHFPRHDWRVVVGELCNLQRRQLLWHDGAFGRHGDVFGWLLFDCCSVQLLVLRLGQLPGRHRIVKLLDMCRGQLLGRCFKRVLELRCWNV